MAEVDSRAPVPKLAGGAWPLVTAGSGSRVPGSARGPGSRAPGAKGPGVGAAGSTGGAGVAMGGKPSHDSETLCSSLLTRYSSARSACKFARPLADRRVRLTVAYRNFVCGTRGGASRRVGKSRRVAQWMSASSVSKRAWSLKATK